MKVMVINVHHLRLSAGPPASKNFQLSYFHYTHFTCVNQCFDKKDFCSRL